MSYLTLNFLTRKTPFFTLFILSRASDNTASQNIGRDGCVGRPPTSNFGGPSPSPPRSPPLATTIVSRVSLGCVGRVDSVLDCQSRGSGFKSRPGRTFGSKVLRQHWYMKSTDRTLSVGRWNGKGDLVLGFGKTKNPYAEILGLFYEKIPL